MAHIAQAASPIATLKARALPIALVGAIVALVIAAFGLFIVQQLQRPYLYDDVSFTVAAEAVARIGIPFANAGYMGDRYDFSKREQWALWHPPLYIYALGLWYTLLGVSEPIGRAFGIACTLLSAGMVGYLGRRLAEPSTAMLTGLVAFALFLLNPLSVQSALVLDIDGTVLLVFVTLLTLLYVKHVQSPARWDIPVLTLVFALALWSKMTTPLGVLFAMLGYRLVERRPLLGLREAAVVGLGGAALFLSSYTLVVVMNRMPWDYPFVTLWQEFTDASESTRQWRESFEKFITAVSPVAWWISPGFLVLGLAALPLRIRDIIQARRAHPIDVILILAVGIYAVYLIKLAGFFPKYHITALPFLSLASAWVVGRTVGAVRRVDLLAWGLALIIFSLYFWRVPAEWYQELFGPLDTLLLIRPLMLSLIVLGLVYIIAGGTIGRHLAMIVVTLVLGWSLGMDWRQSRADFSTNYWYGTHGQRETAAYLDTVVSPDEFWGGAKEVAYYAQNQNYIDQDAIHYWIETYGGFTNEPLSGHQPRVLAAWTGHSYISWLFHHVLANEYEPIAEIGTYTVLIRREVARDLDNAAAD
ncbi:MAG: glycosyltransferase family 39 protein [Chloroflexota bacterium]